jgi:hypothetical protein
MEVIVQLEAQAALIPRKAPPRYLLDIRLGGPQSESRKLWGKIFCREYSL